MKVLITGASGFIGRAVVSRLAADGHEVFAGARSPLSGLPAAAIQVRMNTLGSDADPLVDPPTIDVVVHAAARVHVMREASGDPLALFRRVNVDGSLALARQARAAGARRLVYLSSVKVLGESSPPGHPLSEDSEPSPADAYGISKLEAETALGAFCSDTGMELVIIRPPLVYGPGVRANFERLMQAIARRRPLPFGRLNDNRRSFVALENLVDLIATCIDHPAAAGRMFLVSDGEDLSTAALVRRLARALGVRPRLLPVPVGALRFAGVAVGRQDAVQRLCGSLQVDIGAARRALGWKPPRTVDEGLARAAAQFLRGDGA
jgi:UDP-glucose 4-epimerase